MAPLRFIARGGTRRSNRPKWRLMAVLLALWLGGPLAAIPVQPAHEYQIKAVFLFNFAQFVAWPPAAFADPAAPLVIGVLGDDPFGPTLDETVQGESVGGRPLAVRRYRRPEEIEACHILFISRSETARLGPIIARLGARGILTVSDAEGATRRGVMIGFFTENKRLRLRIDLGAARAAGLVISSKLLRPAEIVSGKEEPR